MLFNSLQFLVFFLVVYILYFVFVADNLATIVNPLFASSPPYNGASVVLALYAFAFQIYCDFAGYSNMARGLGKFMGFDIMVNFNLPYFSTNPREFWQRWHISLSTFLRDYLYIPLGGNRSGPFIAYRNIAITMLLGGLWHGAGWTFIIWGAYHGALIILHKASQPFFAKDTGDKAENTFFHKASFILRTILFFHLVCLGWLFFRANSFTQALQMLQSIFINVHIYGCGLSYQALKILFCVWFLLVIEYVQYRRDNLTFILHSSMPVRAGFYYICVFLLIFFGADAGRQFIYFQF